MYMWIVKFYCYISTYCQHENIDQTINDGNTLQFSIVLSCYKVFTKCSVFERIKQQSKAQVKLT
jgi:hypothetical protein